MLVVKLAIALVAEHLRLPRHADAQIVVAEFGATLMFAGNIPGSTNTMPLEIFSAYQAGEDSRALLYVVVLTAFSGLVTLAASRLAPREGRAT